MVGLQASTLPKREFAICVVRIASFGAAGSKLEVSELISNLGDGANDPSGFIMNVDGVEATRKFLFETTGSSRLDMKSCMEL